MLRFEFESEAVRYGNPEYTYVVRLQGKETEEDIIWALAETKEDAQEVAEAETLAYASSSRRFYAEPKSLP